MAVVDFKVGEGFINRRFTLAISVFSNLFPLGRLITKINSFMWRINQGRFVHIPSQALITKLHKVLIDNSFGLYKKLDPVSGGKQLHMAVSWLSWEVISLFMIRSVQLMRRTRQIVEELTSTLLSAGLKQLVLFCVYLWNPISSKLFVWLSSTTEIIS